MSEAEAAVLGPMWPRARDLAALQTQCLEVLYSLGDAPKGPADARKRSDCHMLIKVGAGLRLYHGE